MRHHALLANEINLARSAVQQGNGGDNKLYFGIIGRNCVYKEGSSQYSTHAWGIATDTNTARNPKFQGCWCWNGAGWDNVNYGNALPEVWKSNQPGYYVSFYWGINWDDSHHFQYATGY